LFAKKKKNSIWNLISSIFTSAQFISNLFVQLRLSQKDNSNQPRRLDGYQGFPIVPKILSYQWLFDKRTLRVLFFSSLRFSLWIFVLWNSFGFLKNEIQRVRSKKNFFLIREIKFISQFNSHKIFFCTLIYQLSENVFSRNFLHLLFPFRYIQVSNEELTQKVLRYLWIWVRLIQISPRILIRAVSTSNLYIFNFDFSSWKQRS